MFELGNGVKVDMSILSALRKERADSRDTSQIEEIHTEKGRHSKDNTLSPPLLTQILLTSIYQNSVWKASYNIPKKFKGILLNVLKTFSSVVGFLLFVIMLFPKRELSYSKKKGDSS